MDHCILSQTCTKTFGMKELTLLLAFAVSYATGSECRFPDFLQSSDKGMGNWTYKYGEGTIHRIQVMGGHYLVFTSSNTSVKGIRPHGWEDRVFVKERKCVGRYGNNTFVVEHVEKKPSYQCVQFIKRSQWVVQLKLSQVRRNWTNICELYDNLDEYPWISLKGYQNSVVTCPFTGGFNFNKIVYSTQDHKKKVQCRDVESPVRVESDCVESDGIQFHFRFSRCIPGALKSKEDCAGKKCMATCEQCANTSSTECEFDSEMIGRWDIRQAGRNVTSFQVVKTGLHHPHLGHLQCVSFNNQREARLRAILWGNYQNGCYPRFLCMHFNIPTTAVMRYRMGNILEWPLVLQDESICNEEHFISPPDMSIPTDSYHAKPWMTAIRSMSRVPTMPCVLPGYLSRQSSFISSDNRTGCIILRPNFAPKTISVVFLESQRRKYPRFRVERFDCVAPLTYTSIVTLSHANRKEVLCWVVLDENTLVVIKTSDCNKWTAKAILDRRESYSGHVKYWLRLGDGGEHLAQTCDHYYKEEQSAWMSGFENLKVERRTTGNTAGKMNFSKMCVFISFLYKLWVDCNLVKTSQMEFSLYFTIFIWYTSFSW